MTQYLSLEEVLYLYSRIIKRTGGKVGIRDLSLLESAMYRPASRFGGNDLYPTLWDKSAAFIHSLINKHPFIDGNKRTGYLATAQFFMLTDTNYVLRKKRRSISILALKQKSTLLTKSRSG